MSGEATNTNFIVFGLTWPGLEPTICHTRGEHANHYTTDAVIGLYNANVFPSTSDIKPFDYKMQELNGECLFYVLLFHFPLLTLQS
jgi:hypothetical protein